MRRLALAALFPGRLQGYCLAAAAALTTPRTRSGWSAAVDDRGMSKEGAQIFTVSECIDHCFSFDMWCYDFARHVDPDDMVMGLHRAFELISDATRLHSFVALRKLDEFFRAEKSQRDDLIASDLGIDRDIVLGGAGKTFLTPTERVNINKGAAHLTESDHKYDHCPAIFTYIDFAVCHMRLRR